MLIAILVSTIISVVFVICYASSIKPENKQYVTVNTDIISKTFLSAIIKANLSDNKYKNILLMYDKKLSDVINKVSLQNNFIILKKNTVLTELPDITTQVQDITFQELHLQELLQK